MHTSSQYDADCEEVEGLRQKQTRAQDEKHKGRAAKQVEQQNNDMFNSKNTYLISTAIANQVKDKYFTIVMPNVQNEFQRLQTRLVERLIKILLHGQSLQLNHLDELKKRIDSVDVKLSQVRPSQDQALFIDHNIRPFNAPGHWKFEPCASHYDTDAMSIEPAPKVFLQNKLVRSRTSLQELGPLILSKQTDLDQLSRRLQGLVVDHSTGEIDDLTDSYLEAQHQLAYYSNSQCILDAEIRTIISAIGDDEGVRAPHAFKSSTFSIPTQCGYCEVPADCPEGVPSGPSISRSTTATSRLSTAAAITPSPSSFVLAQASEEEGSESYPQVPILFDFTPSSEFELGVHGGFKVLLSKILHGAYELQRA
ncbi:hypothetical protein NP233_g952 [Leucocoprinus birnbaumii]|uniref:F-BAR domain-containing protein n=1 Tax=Leucocoprinus birnbaumii TaxID=56174 RepID=A0AAD5W202_9AGAR|nr:hypothetical protein NP233_g952 [Leucocoprinus birnbaumii]